jgi:hypothetical protein
MAPFDEDARSFATCDWQWIRLVQTIYFVWEKVQSAKVCKGNNEN